MQEMKMHAQKEQQLRNGQEFEHYMNICRCNVTITKNKKSETNKNQLQYNIRRMNWVTLKSEVVHVRNKTRRSKPYIIHINTIVTKATLNETVYSESANLCSCQNFNQKWSGI